MSQRTSDLARIVEVIASTPTFYLLGSAKGRLVLYTNMGGSTSIWALDPDTGARVRLTREPVHSFSLTRADRREVVFTRDVSSGRELQVPMVTFVDEPGEKVIADVPPARVLGISFHGGKVAYVGATGDEVALYLLDFGGSWEKLASLGTMAYLTDLNDRYAVGYGIFSGDPRSYELFIYDLGSGELSVYTPRRGSSNTSPVLMGSKVLFESSAGGRGRLYIYDLESEELEPARFGASDYARFNPIEHMRFGWLSSGGVWAIGKRNGRSRLFVDGRSAPTPLGVVSSFAELDGRLFVTASSLVSPPQVYEVDLKSGTSRVVLANPLPRQIRRALRRRYFARYRSFDGRSIPAYVVESSAAGRPGPTVVYVHGGPWGEVMDAWDVFIASLAAAGYNVVAPNFRGSTGYGEAFRVLDIGDPGGGDLNDIAYAARWAVERGLASRLAVMGYSYGGYSTLMALGRFPELWSAGVAGASVADWEEMYGLSDAYFRRFIDVLFGGRKDLMRERSPITYVDNVRAPLCIIHPANDTRTPLKPVLRYVQRLAERGATFEAHILPETGHFIARVEDRVGVILPALAFLKRYFA